MRSLQTTSMLWIAGALFFGFISRSEKSLGDDGSTADEPFVVFVAQEEAFTRCGPANDYYRADPLRYGQELEVYVETADGWLGVRPPENSFCWIPADSIKLSSDGESGVVIEDRSVAWIGTHLGRAREYRWQVQLAEGEPVTVIGRSERDGPDGPQLWYRMVPPSGEFRWVHSEQIVHSAEELVAAVRQAASQDIDFLPSGPSNARVAAATSHQRETSPRATPVRHDAVADHDESPQAVPSSRRAQPSASLSELAQDDVPLLRKAPEPGRNPDTAIGSGLSEQWRRGETESSADANHSSRYQQTAATESGTLLSTQNGSLSSARFLGGPKLTDIDASVRQIGQGLLEPASGGESFAPSGLEAGGDSNWVTGSPRSHRDTVVHQALSQQPITPSFAHTPSTATPYLPQPVRQVSAEAITAVRAGVDNADIDQLSLIFSRMMAESATSVEMNVVADAANRIAQAETDQVTVGRARLLAERIEQYRRIAERRDGGNGASQTHSGNLSRSQAGSPPQSQSAAVPAPSIPEQREPANVSESGEVTQAGFLVQVYSARKDSPPFAITDNRGRTVAYLTPAPGLNLRMHLNSEIQVRGTPTFLQGVNTPHLLVSSAVRVSP